MLISFVRFVLGIATMVFFRCMTGLFDPEHRRGERVKWGLVSYTAAMFSLLTVLTATNFDVFSISYIDNRQFPGGPGAYMAFVLPTTLNPVPDAMAVFSNWLADGLLVSSLLDPAFTHQVSDVGSSPSFIVATLSTP